MPETMLPSAFAELEKYAQTWCLATETERWNARVSAHDAGAARVLRRVLPPS